MEGSEMENGSRIATFDIAKAVVLLMVVGGHLVGNGIVANCNEWCDPYFANFKDGVTMPLFYMMSGYFSATSIRNGSWGKIIARTIGFLWPVAAFGVIFGFVIGLTGTKPLWKILLYPAARVAFGGWFGHHIFGLCGFSAVRSDRQTTLDSFVVLLCGAFLYAAQSAVSLVVKCIPHVPIFRVRYVCFTPL